jgi:hypothetical protein
VGRYRRWPLSWAAIPTRPCGCERAYPRRTLDQRLSNRKRRRRALDRAGAQSEWFSRRHAELERVQRLLLPGIVIVLKNDDLAASDRLDAAIRPFAGRYRCRAMS